MIGVEPGGPAEGIRVLVQAVHETNLLDPDLYGAGNHLQALSELRAQADAPIIKIEDPLAGVPYWAFGKSYYIHWTVTQHSISTRARIWTRPKIPPYCAQFSVCLFRCRGISLPRSVQMGSIRLT